MRTARTPEELVLALLAPGGMLTVKQLARQAPMTEHCARKTVGALARRGWIVSSSLGAAWFLTSLGERAVAR